MFGREKSTEAHRPLVDRSDDLDELESLPSQAERHEPRRRTSWWAYGAVAALLLTSNLLSFHLGERLATTNDALDSLCAAHTTQHSPLLDEVKVKYSMQEFNGSFLNENIYRQKGSPEVDQAWSALGVDYRAGIISREQGLASGLGEHFVQRSDKYGGGFFVNVEGMHHLHCLNLVRKALYFNYEYYQQLGEHAFKNKEHILRKHVTHCLDSVRQVLMCNVDTGVLGQIWAGSDEPTAFPDFKTQHKCKNYESIRAWSEKLQAPPQSELPVDYIKLPDPRFVLPAIP